MLGADLAATVDAVESHHDEPGPDLLTGRVVAVHAVTQEFRNRRVARDPARLAPMESRLRLTPTDAKGEAVWAGAAPPTPYYIESVSVPRTGQLVPVERVPRPAAAPSAAARARLKAALRGEGPAEWSTRDFEGYLVDVERIESD